MKIILLVAAVCGNLLATASPSPNTLSGKIDGVESGWVYLLHRQKDNYPQDSIQIKDGQFSFNGTVDGPEYCLLGIKNKTGKKQFSLGFFLDNGATTVTGKSDALQDAIVSGSPTQDEYTQFRASLKPIEDRQQAIGKLWDSAEMSKNTKLLDSVMQAYKAIGKEQQLAIKEYTASHPKSYVATYVIYENFSYDPDADLLQEIFGSLDPSMQTTFFGKQIKETLDAALLTNIGKPAPNFALKNALGKDVALSSLKGKYVLIDFWASWCGPCRAENPAVVKAYQKFKAKGFTILGVSLDDKKDKWLEAVKKDKLEWNQVSDLKGWKSSAASLYGIKGIPMNFLIDKDGKIIAKGLRGEELEKKLAEVMN